MVPTCNPYGMNPEEGHYVADVEISRSGFGRRNCHADAEYLPIALYFG